MTLTTPDDRPSGTQGWFVNTRRPHLSDPLVRQALSHAFDFEWTNRQHFHDLYKRTQSYFENSEMKATGTPDAAELALLEPFRGQVPDSVFDEVYVPPVSNASGQDRRQLKIARDLLADAGWDVREGVLKNASDEPFTLEFLSDTPTFERVLQPFIKNLALLGIDAKIRLVDAAQFEERLKDFDFDIITRRFSMRETPGVELRAFMGSEAAAQEGSRNLAGISNPAIDALIDKVTEATSREDLVTAAVPWTVCCGPDTTGFPSGTRRSTIWPCGTSLLNPRSSRNIIGASFACGGSILKRKLPLTSREYVSDHH